MIWLEAPPMLAAKSDAELAELKRVCRVHRKRFAHIEKERIDADQTLRLIVHERRRRFFEPTRAIQ